MTDTGGTGEQSLHLPVDQFERQIKWLHHNFDLLTLDRVFESHQRGERLQGAVAITFDDAYRGIFDHALPVLRQHVAPATIFLVGTAPEGDACFWWDHPVVAAQATPATRQRWLDDLGGDQDTIYRELGISDPDSLPDSLRPATWDIIRAALDSRGDIAVGAHTMAHRNVVTMSEEQVTDDAEAVSRTIAKRLGTSPRFYAYPYGLWSPHARRAVMRAGYAAALTLDGGFCDPEIDPGSLPRLNVPAGIPQSTFEAWVSFGGPPFVRNS